MLHRGIALLCRTIRASFRRFLVPGPLLGSRNALWSPAPVRLMRLMCSGKDFDRKPIRVNDKMNVDIEVDDTEDDILGVLRKAAGIQKDTEIQVSIAGKLVRKITYDKMEPNANYDVAAIQSQTSSEVTLEEAMGRVDRLAQDLNADELWTRPTNAPSKYRADPGFFWPDTRLHCPGNIPHPRALDDGRTSAWGIGNGMGTGKTEIAVRSAEMTCQHEPDLHVAYISFGNASSSEALSETIADTSRRAVAQAREFQFSKYCGLWLLAGKRSTRIAEDGMLQVNSKLFKRIVADFLQNPHWELPRYGDLADPKLIVIFDEVQQFKFEALEGFITMEVTPSGTRGSLLVGAFSPPFVMGSENRLRDVRFNILHKDVVQEMFKEVVPDANLYHDGVHLPSLFGGCVRPLVNWCITKEDLMANNDPVRKCLQRYQEFAPRYRVPASLFRAALADVPFGRQVLEDAFKMHNMSLGAAFVSVQDGKPRISLPPLHVASGRFDVEDAADHITREQLQIVINGFCKPAWSQFEALVGIAPAFRLAALSCTTMDYELDKSSLELVFGGTVANAKAKTILRGTAVQSNLRVRYVNGGTNVEEAKNLFLEVMQEKEIVTISMSEDHDAEFDHFLIVPCEGKKKIMVCLDSKFSKEGNKPYLNFESDIQPKLDGLRRLLKTRLLQLPKGYEPFGIVVVIASNCKISPDQAAKVTKSRVALVVISHRDLPRLLSSNLTPPKYR